MAVLAYSGLRLAELHILATLLRERSLSRTAELLDTTQPAVSKVLARLRGQFADPLFVRNGHAMQPTTKALDLAQRLRTLLAAADDLRAAVATFDPARSHRQFNLLLTDVGMIHFLPPLVARVAALAPSVSLRAAPLQSHQFEAALETGEADLAIGAYPKAARHLRRQRLYSDGYKSVVRKSHARLSRIGARKAFLDEQHILVTASELGHAAHGVAQRTLAGEIPATNILLQVPSFIAAAIVAAETDGIATLPANVAHRLAAPLGLAAFDCPVTLPRIEIAQYWHERYHRDDGHRWIRSMTFELFRRKA